MTRTEKFEATLFGLGLAIALPATLLVSHFVIA